MCRISIEVPLVGDTTLNLDRMFIKVATKGLREIRIYKTPERFLIIYLFEKATLCFLTAHQKCICLKKRIKVCVSFMLT